MFYFIKLMFDASLDVAETTMTEAPMRSGTMAYGCAADTVALVTHVTLSAPVRHSGGLGRGSNVSFAAHHTPHPNRGSVLRCPTARRCAQPVTQPGAWVTEETTADSVSQ